MNNLYERLRKETNNFERAICNFPKKYKGKVSRNMTYNAFIHDNIHAAVVGADTDMITLYDGSLAHIPHIPHNKILSILGESLKEIVYYNKSNNMIMSRTLYAPIN